MVIFFRKPIFETTTKVIETLADVEAKRVEVISIDKEVLKLSLVGLTKKEITNFLNNGFELVELAPKKNILVYDSKRATA